LYPVSVTFPWYDVANIGDMSAKKKKIVAVSGGFDPVHVGHVRLLKEAKKLGDELVVILNNDEWLRGKKGLSFMQEKERKEVLESIQYVDRVFISKHKKGDPDRSVCRELAQLKPHVFANGGDRRAAKDIPEAEVCRRLGITMTFNVGKGGKVQSSSWLTDRVVKASSKKRTKR
jgi:cytidyltransferase-like protein